MASVEEEIRQCQAAIAIQESLRASLGDAVVDLTVTALRGRIKALELQMQGPAPSSSTDRLLEQLHGYLPRELADKMRAFGRIEGERKQVTVLFADISGFTTLSERLDPEEVAVITNEVLKEMASAVYEFEGYIDKFIGDAVMAVFGAPVSHEDDPGRALRAALSMRERMEDFNRRWLERVGEPLTLHIGINTGLVIAGNIGSDMRLAYTVMGDTVNTASRLESAACPGQILVSRDTYRLVEDAFAFVALDPMPVKGKREPLVVYELHHARLTPVKSRGFKEFKPVFVERERELAALAALGERLHAGRGHIVVVEGEAGIGKSRLIAQWRASLPSELLWLEGRSFPHTASLPYGPFQDLFLRYACVGDEEREELVRLRLRTNIERFFPGNLEAQALLASMLSLRPTAEEDALLGEMPVERRRRALFAVIHQWVLDLARARPIVLVFEDMHWTDTTSVELIQHLMSLTQDHPLIVVSLYRADLDAAPHVVRATVAAQYHGHSTHLLLAAISERGSARMVEELLQSTALPASIQRTVLHKAEGNPFFIEEVLRMLVERGALVRSTDGWVVTDLLDQVSIPDTLHGVLMARIDRLYPETRWIVQQAAVIGRIFLYRVLLQMASSDDIEVDIDLLEREGLICERSRQPEVEYMFKHALTQEVAYQSLLAPRRKEIHRKIGAAIEGLFADRLAKFFPVIGRHFLMGEEWARAADYLGRSGDAAARLYAHIEARIHYDSALRALENLPPDDKTDRAAIVLTIGLVKVSMVADEPGVNLSRLEAAERRAQRLLERGGGLTEDRLSLARIELYRGTCLSLRGPPFSDALACFERVLPVAMETQDEELLVVPSAMIGKAMVTCGQFKGAVPLLRRVLEPLSRWDDQTEWILTAVFLGLAEAAGGRWREGQRIASEALARARETCNSRGQVYGHLFLAVIAMHTGDMPRVLLESQRTLKLAEESGDRMYCYFSHGYQALARSRMGEHEAAGECLARQRSIAAGIGGHIVTDDWFAAIEAEVALNAGQVEAALALGRAAMVYAASTDDFYGEGLARRVCAQALLAMGGRWPEVEEQLAASVECFDRGGARLEMGRTYALWGRGDGAHGRLYLARALDLYEQAGLITDAARLRAELEAHGGA